MGSEMCIRDRDIRIYIYIYTSSQLARWRTVSLGTYWYCCSGVLVYTYCTVFFLYELRESIIIIIMLISGHVRGLVLFVVVCIYTEDKPERRNVKNTPTTPTAAELAPPHYGRYRSFLTFLGLLLWASIEATTATDRYPNGRAS